VIKALFPWFGFSLCTLGYLGATGNRALAQVTSDGTVNTQVNRNGNVDEITRGETRGDNLFHSFQDFSVSTGDTASFLNANDIANIFSRVTGGNISNIDGLISANGSANLFLINPAGILFGENARLDIGGSFLGSTADSVLFEDGEFSATDLDNPPLLTINAPIGLNFRDNPGDITIRGNRQGTRTTSDLIDTQDALRVNSNKTLFLVGGNLLFEGATIKTEGGKIELGSVEGNQQVSFTPVSESFSLGYDGVQSFRDIKLSETATIDASGEGGGNIRVQGRNITLTDGSQIEASTLGSLPGGNLDVIASESVELSGFNSSSVNTSLSKIVYPDATESAGNINVNARSLNISNGGFISSRTFGKGNAGNISIQTENINISNNSDFLTGVFAFVDTGAIGNGGQININTENLNISNGVASDSFISVSTLGQGDAGVINILATESVDLLNNANIWSVVFESGQGNAGSVNIEASSLELDDFSKVSVESFGQGNSGNLVVDADLISLFDGSQIIGSIEGKGEGGNLIVNAETIEIVDSFGESSTGIRPTGIVSNVNQGGEGNGGDINITAKNISLDGFRAEISASVFGEGNAGEARVKATESIDITKQSGIFADVVNTDNTGQGGNLNIDTPNLNLSDAGIISVENLGEGNAGILAIDTDLLSILDGSIITGDVSGTGDGADIFINAKSIQIDDLFSQTGSSSLTGIFADVGFEANGDAGNITITTEKLKISGLNSKISSSLNISSASGNGGVLEINASKFISIQGTSGTFSSDETGIFANVSDNATTGNSGSVNINTPLLFLDHGTISVNNQGQGSGGELFVDTNSIELKNNSQFVAETVNRGGANIVLSTSKDIILRGNSFISARALNNADGGNLKIDTNFIVAFPSNGNGNDIIASAAQGEGGNITIHAESLLGIAEGSAIEGNDSNDIDASSQVFGLDGTVTINTLDVDPLQGATELPSNVVEAKQTAEQTCSADRDGKANNGLAIAGRGGVTPPPDAPLNSENISNENPAQASIPEPIETAQGKIQPARGIKFTKDGRIILTAYRTNNAGERIPEIEPNCKTELGN
jgi:filamentous hemagglutinin family protein